MALRCTGSRDRNPRISGGFFAFRDASAHDDLAVCGPRLSVTCPGSAADPATAHRRLVEGSWRVADLAVS